ncbi:MAG: SDR family oxidoreductase [Deltaproteobacteria bacterium]|nr:SDR family oxidoreductase [Deltaproteobacteria bacterium]
MTEATKKVALVTGGAQGIGRAICLRLVNEGMRVEAADLDAEAVAERNAAFSPSLRHHVADVSCEEDVKSLVEHIEQAHGRLDVLINNAAIVNPVNAPIEQLALADWNKVIATNLTGAFLCVKYATPLLRKSGGAIVNIASTRALQSEANTEAYGTSKGGLVALTHALAVSLGPLVRVNCISPGWIATAAFQKESKRTDPTFSSRDHLQHPAGRVGVPEDIAAMVAYLASSDAGFITGQNFVIDGGMTRKMIYEE